MSKTNGNRLYGKSVYLKVAVPQTDDVNTNVYYFRQAIKIIGEGHEGRGRKRIQQQTNCTGNEIRKIYKVVSSVSNWQFVKRNSGVLGIEDYHACIRLSLDRFETIIKYIISTIEIEKKTDIFNEYLNHHPTYSQTTFQALFHEMLDSWNAMNSNRDLCEKYNIHLGEGIHKISCEMYENTKDL